MTDGSALPGPEESQPRWGPLPAMERRGVGVLTEKDPATPRRMKNFVRNLIKKITADLE